MASGGIEKVVIWMAVVVSDNTSDIDALPHCYILALANRLYGIVLRSLGSLLVHHGNEDTCASDPLLTFFSTLSRICTHTECMSNGMCTQHSLP